MDMLCEVLRETYEVCSANTVEGALSLLVSGRFDVVLADYHVPGGAIEALVEQVERAQVPMVWMTGHPRAVEKLGTTSRIILTKPFRVNQMVDALARARASVGRPSASSV